jgi:hypothetical protein
LGQGTAEELKRVYVPHFRGWGIGLGPLEKFHPANFESHSILEFKRYWLAEFWVI